MMSSEAVLTQARAALAHVPYQGHSLHPTIHLRLSDGALILEGEVADIVVLTNLGDHAHPWRVEQLASHGIHHEVVTNQGGKGVPARAIIQRHGATRTAFVDDLPVHHASVAKHAPEVYRVHMVAEPRLAPAVPTAEHAHVRIDRWDEACPWILERLTQ